MECLGITLRIRTLKASKPHMFSFASRTRKPRNLHTLPSWSSQKTFRTPKQPRCTGSSSGKSRINVSCIPSPCHCTTSNHGSTDLLPPNRSSSDAQPPPNHRPAAAPATAPTSPRVRVRVQPQDGQLKLFVFQGIPASSGDLERNMYEERVRWSKGT